MNGKMNNKLTRALILLGILLLSFSIPYLSFSRTPYAVGRDAYFHIIQARSLIEDGKNHAPDSSLTPYIFALSYKLTGDWVQAQKALLGILIALFTLVSYLAGLQLFYRKKEGDRQLWALLLALLISASPTLTHLAAQYLKQLLGMVSLMLFIWAMLWNLKQDELYEDKQEDLHRQVLRRGLMFAAVILAVFSHRLSGVMALLGMAFALPWLWLLIGGGLGLGLLVLGSMFMPGILSVFDLERLRGLLNIIPSFHPLSISRNLQLNPGWILEMLLPYITLVLIVVLWIRKKLVPTRIQWYLLSLLVLGIFPFYTMHDLDFGFRLFIAVIPFLPLLYLSLLADNTLFSNPLLPVYRHIAVMAVSVLFLLSSFFVFQPDKMLPYQQYTRVIHKAEKVLNEVEPEIVILHHGFSFYYTYVTYRHTLPFIPDWEVRDQDVYRIAFNIPDSAIAQYVPALRPTPLRLSEDYTLFREDVWQSMLAGSQGDELIQFRMQNPMNPYQKRPSYLSKFQEHAEE